MSSMRDGLDVEDRSGLITPGLGVGGFHNCQVITNFPVIMDSLSGIAHIISCSRHCLAQQGGQNILLS